MKRLLVTADDFGLSPAVNRGVEKGWRDGIVTGASLMVTGNAAEDAVAVAKRCPGLKVGLHLVLLQGRSAAHHDSFPSLTDRRGYFADDPVLGGMRLYFLPPLRRQIRREIEAQCDRFLAFGLPLTHVDGHLNIHLHPTVAEILLELAPRYGIRSIRLSREPVTLRRIGRPHAVDALILGILSRRLLQRLQRMGIGFVDRVYGVVDAGGMDEGRILEIVRNIPDGVTEIVTHPSDGEDEETRCWHPGYRGADELAALTSPELARMIRQKRVELVNYDRIRSSGEGGGSDAQDASGDDHRGHRGNGG